MLFGKTAADILARVKKICPIRHVGIVKVKLLSDPREVAPLESITAEKEAST